MLEARVDWIMPGGKGAAPHEAAKPYDPLLVRAGGAYTPSWAVLLEKFYRRLGRPLPWLEQLKEEAVPRPYHGLLVHSSDMTPTLEGFYHRRLELTVLSREIEEESYLREVVLKVSAAESSTRGEEEVPALNVGETTLGAKGSSRPVAYGVIRICLDHFPLNARRRVLEEQRPLGNILQSEGIPHISWPQAFFRAGSEPHTSAVLGLRGPCELYGRRNVLLDGTRRLLAEVIEILAPVGESESGSSAAR